MEDETAPQQNHSVDPTETAATPPAKLPDYASQMFKGLVNSNLAITKLGDDILVIDILKRWGKSTKWKFFVKEDALDRKPPAVRSGSKLGLSSSGGSGSGAVSVPPPAPFPKTKSNHKAPILICASEKNSGIHLSISSIPLNKVYLVRHIKFPTSPS
jgi:hypothetical protein